MLLPVPVLLPVLVLLPLPVLLPVVLLLVLLPVLGKGLEMSSRALTRQGMQTPQSLRVSVICVTPVIPLPPSQVVLPYLEQTSCTAADASARGQQQVVADK